MSYSITNLADVEDAAAARGLGDTNASRFPRTDIAAEQVGLAHHTLRPGKRLPFGHRHQAAEEVHLVIRGSGRAKLDDEIVELSENDILRLSPQVMRSFEAGPDGLEYVVFGTHHEGDGEMDPEFWKG